MIKNEYLSEFYFFSEYLKKTSSISNAERYKNDISAFLLHMSHLKAYDFAKSFCQEKKVLEIGCNIGYGTKSLGKLSKKIIAIDLNYEVLKFAKDNYSTDIMNFIKANALSLPFANHTFDVVISYQVIEHIKPNQVLNFLSEIKRVLKEEGIALLTTPNRKLRLFPFQKPCNPEHYTEYTVKRLIKILMSSFKNVELQGLRAENWIEEIEKRRINKTIYQAYFIRPIYNLFKLILPFSILQLLKKIRSNFKQPEEQNNLQSQRIFGELVNRFSMDSFTFKINYLDKSLYLIAVCNK